MKKLLLKIEEVRFMHWRVTLHDESGEVLATLGSYISHDWAATCADGATGTLKALGVDYEQQTITYKTQG